MPTYSPCADAARPIGVEPATEFGSLAATETAINTTKHRTHTHSNLKRKSGVRTIAVVCAAVVSFAVGCGEDANPRPPRVSPTGVAGAETFACASLGDDGIACWGPDIATVRDGRSYVAIAAARTTACGLTDDRQVVCRTVRKARSGVTAFGAPVVLSGVEDVTDIAMDHSGLCVVAAGRQICQPFPLAAKSRQFGRGNAVRVTGPSGGCALLQDGTVFCSPRAGEPREIVLLGGAVDVAADSRGGCAVLSDGRVQCWDSAVTVPGGGAIGGRNPTLVDGLSPASAVAMGSAFCTITTSLNVECTGEDSYGVLGDGTYRENGRKKVAVSVKNVHSVAALGGGAGGYFCAVSTRLGVMCWGLNMYGALGVADPFDSGPRSIPIPAP